MNVIIRPTKTPDDIQYCDNLDRLITNALGHTHSYDIDMDLFDTITNTLYSDGIKQNNESGITSVTMGDASDDSSNYIATKIIKQGHIPLAAAWSLARTYPIILDFQAKSDTIASCVARTDHSHGYDIEMPRATYDAIMALFNVPNETTDERVGVFSTVSINAALNIHEKNPIVKPYAANLRYLIAFLQLHNMPTLDVV